MPFIRLCLILVVFLVCGTADNEDIPCKEAKLEGYKVECPAWTKCGAECEWYVTVPCEEGCIAGIQKNSRSRPCKYFDEEKNKNIDCLDEQDRKLKCKLPCGANGFYNEALDFCECKENFDGACCNKRIKACESPVVKRGETDRSIAHVGKRNRCDNRLRPSWYKFESPAGNQMPTECVAAGSCNTVVPFWLNGTHPKPKDGVVERVACGTQGSNCCEHKLKIKVRNCGDFMSYYLVPTGGCSKAYCIGTDLKCPDGESSDTGYQHDCSKNFPNVKVVPKVGYLIKNTLGKNQVFLTCSVLHPDAAQYMWKVQWFFDGVLGSTEAEKRPSNNPIPQFYLSSSVWSSKMGSMAQCTMQAKFANGMGTWSEGNVFSAEYYLGILIDQKVVTVKEGNTAVITLRPNLPVRCHEKNEAIGDCFLQLSISLDPTARGPRCPGTPAEISQVIFEGGTEIRCAYKDITHKTWNLANQLKIKPKLDIQLDGTQSRTMRLRVNEEGTSIPLFWQGYVLPTVQINILDSDDRGTCKMVNDPHITTFDNRQYDFHDRPNQQGNNQIFVVYKHKIESEEVQARFVLCAGNIYCICGVSMRAGSSTVVFDRCRTSPNLIPELNYKVRNAPADSRIRVFKHNSGTRYHVFLPTGTQVQVSTDGGNQISFEIKASVELKNKIVGLCGNYNGDPKDDIQNSQSQEKCPHYNIWYRCEDESFRTSWHVPEAESIFAGKVPPHNPGEREDKLYCDCISEAGHHGYEDCDYHKRYEPCDQGYEMFKPHRQKRQADEEYPWTETYRGPQHVNPDFEEAATADRHRYERSWAPNTYTEQTARAYCTDKLLSSPAVMDCLNEVPNQNYTSNIEACALDLVLTGSTEYVAPHLESVKSSCNQELRMNLDLWEPREDDDGEDEGKPTIVGPPLRLMENLCPNECSGNGACIDGKCTCKKSFASYDCSLRVDEVPVIKGVSSSAVPCDRSSQDCSVIALEGMKFLEGPSLTCHYYKDDESDGQYFYSGEARAAPVSTAAGNLFSVWVVQCGVPLELSSPVSSSTTLNKLQVAVSNDGLKQSDRAFYGSYDARCESCVGRTCTRKNDSCIISSQCYGRGELNPTNKDEACNPYHRGYAWSPASTLTSSTTLPTTTSVRTTTTPQVITRPVTDTRTDTASTLTSSTTLPTTPPVRTAPPRVLTRPVNDTRTVTDGKNIVCNLKPNKRSYHRDPDSCNKYYVCDGKLKRHMECPLGLAFSDKLHLCVYTSWLKLKECMSHG